MLSHQDIAEKPPILPDTPSRKRRRSSDDVVPMRRSINVFSSEELHVAKKIAIAQLAAETLVTSNADSQADVDMSHISTPIRHRSFFGTPSRYNALLLATPSRRTFGLPDDEEDHGPIAVQMADSAHFFATPMTKRRTLQTLAFPLANKKITGFMGVDLESLLQRDYVLVSGRLVVPSFVFYLVEWLKLNGLTQKGLFVNLGNSVKSNQLLALMEQEGGLTDVFLNLAPSDALEVAHVLIRFLTNIPRGLIPNNLHAYLKTILVMSRSNKGISKSTVRLLRNVMLLLPVPNRALLQYFMELCTYCLRLSSHNKVSKRDFAMSVGSCLFGGKSSPSQPGSLSLNDVWQERVFELLLQAQEFGQGDGQDVVKEGLLWTVSIDSFYKQVLDKVKISKTPISKRGSFSQSLAIMTPKRMAVLASLTRTIDFGSTPRKLFQDNPDKDTPMDQGPKFAFSFGGRITMVGDVNRDKFSKRRRIE